MHARSVLTMLYATFALALLAVATPFPNNPPPVTVTVTATAPAATATAATCSTGAIQCCNTVEAASSAGIGIILGLLGIVLGDLTSLVGLGCSPISVVGVGGGECNANAVCCENNNVGGLISIGCLPIIL